MIASKVDIIARESLGYSHIVWRGESYFVNLNAESSRLKFKSYLEKKTGRAWGIAKLDRYVFYRKDMYTPDNNHLKLNDLFRGKIEIPINIVSCKMMFSNKNLERIDFSDFDTSGIEDMQLMFEFASFPKNFSLGDKFNTSSVRNMRGMFSQCIFQKGFSLGKNFDTSRVKNMGKMFFNCTFPKGFFLGDKFNTSNVENMQCMFSYTKFNDYFSLGNKFNTSKVNDMQCMFHKTNFNENFRLDKDFTICTNAGDMFTDAKLPSRVATQLSGKVTYEEVIELLKSDVVAMANFF